VFTVTLWVSTSSTTGNRFDRRNENGVSTGSTTGTIVGVGRTGLEPVTDGL
jgi:hypothetical protein